RGGPFRDWLGVGGVAAGEDDGGDIAESLCGVGGVVAQDAALSLVGVAQGFFGLVEFALVVEGCGVVVERGEGIAVVGAEDALDDREPLAEDSVGLGELAGGVEGGGVERGGFQCAWVLGTGGVAEAGHGVLEERARLGPLALFLAEDGEFENRRP